MATTHKEKDEKIKLLKDEVRKLRGEVKSTESTLEGLTGEAYGLIINESGYGLVSIKFDVESGKAAIENVKDLGKSIGNASTKVKIAVIDTLVEMNKRRR